MQTIALHPTGRRHSLPERMLGLNSETVFVSPDDDPAMLEPTRQLGPAVLRFPGGTPSNFFDWRTGRIDVPDVEGASDYRKMFIRLQPLLNRIHQDGVSMERFARIAETLGADVILVPNLETSTIPEQTAWVEQLRSRDALPRRIEMGNEFHFAMIGDAESARLFPDWTTTARHTRQYVDAFHPHLHADTVIAAQAAGSRFYATEDSGEGLLHRIWTWDDEMAPEPWFDAVTAHFYPDLDLMVGREAADGFPENVERVLPALLARIDAGSERALAHIESRMPDKQIWITEWGAWPLSSKSWLLSTRQEQSGEPHPAVGPFQAFWLQYVARGLLSLLRHPAVTVILYHSLGYVGGVWSVFDRSPSGSYEPIGPCELLRWFNEAANGGGAHEILEARGSKLLPGGGVLAGESYRDVEAALFTRDGGHTVIAHNATGSPVVLDVSSIADGRIPSSVETMHTPDLLAVLDHALPTVDVILPRKDIHAPPWSVTRIRWPQD